MKKLSFILLLLACMLGGNISKACIPEWCAVGPRSICIDRTGQYVAVTFSGGTYGINGTNISLTIYTSSGSIGPMMPTSVTPSGSGYEYRYYLTFFNIIQQCYNIHCQSTVYPGYYSDLTVCPCS